MNTTENRRWIEQQCDSFADILYILCQLKGMKYDIIFLLLFPAFLGRVEAKTLDIAFNVTLQFMTVKSGS